MILVLLDGREIRLDLKQDGETCRFRIESQEERAADIRQVEPGVYSVLLGGRSYQGSQFDRAGQALRQPGSSFKPVVYAAAFETGKVTPSTPLEDTPLTIRKAGLVLQSGPHRIRLVFVSAGPEGIGNVNFLRVIP